MFQNMSQEELVQYINKSDEKIKSLKRMEQRIYAIVITISFICSIPFMKFIMRSDWDKPNSIEVLQQVNPEGYTKWRAEVDVDDPNNPHGEYPDMEYFAKPIHYVSFFLAIPFLFVLVSIIGMGYWLVALWMWLPTVIKYAVCIAIYYLIILYISLKIVIFFENKEYQKQLKAKLKETKNDKTLH